MRTILLFVLIIISVIAQTQEVIVTLTARYNQNNVSLDTIILENITQPNIAVLAPLPVGIDSYQVDLLHGKIIYGLNEKNDGFGIFPDINQPGNLQIRFVLLENETFRFLFYSINGKLLHDENLMCNSGTTLVKINPGKEPACILRIESKKHKTSFKCTGNPDGKEDISIRQETQNSGVQLNKKSSGLLVPFEFVFTPGDKVKFTAIKNGLYSNFKTSKPVNHDSVFIKLGSPCVVQPVVYDFDQNAYQTVQIGDQCWFRENLKTKHYADGTPLVDGTGIGDFCNDFNTKYWFDYNDDPSLSSIYGRLYTGSAVMNSKVYPSQWDTTHYQGICPNGWHMPNDQEWMSLEVFLGMGVERFTPERWRGTNQGDLLKATDIVWKNNGYGTDDYGFNGLPAGIRGCNNRFDEFGVFESWWTGTSFGFGLVYRMLGNYTSQIYKGSLPTDSGFSCRCIKN